MWIAHINKTLSAEGTNSKNRGHWDRVLTRNKVTLSRGAHRVNATNVAGLWRELPNVTAPSAQLLNRPVTYVEVMDTLHRLAPNKAPGRSGVTINLLRTALASRDNEHGYIECPLGVLIFTLVRDMLSYSHVPFDQRIAHLVLILKKKGDATQVGDYRGISLLESVLKLATALVARRLSTALEDCRLLDRAQGGFRPGEEAISQVVALHELCCRQRDKQAGPSHVLISFLDYKAAFDRVGHEALFKKLELVGCSGMAVNFLRAVYSSSLVSIALPSSTSKPIAQQRGVKQGDPASPVLFNVFINDLVASAPLIRRGSPWGAKLFRRCFLPTTWLCWLKTPPTWRPSYGTLKAGQG